jgi:uncharacterized membrane protein
MGDLESRITRVGKELADARADVDRDAKKRRTKDRSLIALVVVFAFVAVVMVVTATALWGDWTKLEAPAEYVMNLLGSVLLPVVTLVIGYYFGKEN